MKTHRIELRLSFDLLRVLATASPLEEWQLVWLDNKWLVYPAQETSFCGLMVYDTAIVKNNHQTARNRHSIHLSFDLAQLVKQAEIWDSQRELSGQLLIVDLFYNQHNISACLINPHTQESKGLKAYVLPAVQRHVLETIIRMYFQDLTLHRHPIARLNRPEHQAQIERFAQALDDDFKIYKANDHLDWVQFNQIPKDRIFAFSVHSLGLLKK